MKTDEISEILSKYFIDVDPTNFKINSNLNSKELKENDIFIGRISTTIKYAGKKKRLNNMLGVYKVIRKYDVNKLELVNHVSNTYKTSTSAIKILNYEIDKEKILNFIENLNIAYENNQREKYLEEFKEKCFDFSEPTPEEKLAKVIDSGIKNIWMVGPAGCGKSTMARSVAKSLNLPYPGKYKSANVEKLDIRICIKKPEEPVIKPLLLTCISPWFFRYYIFCYYNSILDTNIGLGSAKKLSEISDTKDIYIDNGECLTYDLAKFKIESIKNLFNSEYESEHMLNAHS